MTEKNRFANRYEVMNVPCPEPTETWNPISHARLLGALDLGVKTMGIEVRSETYTLAREGKRLFGSWVLDIGNGAKWMIGFRQGLDKSMAIGITAGTYVMVCSNMCFSGEFLEFRMHTSGLTQEELIALVARSLEALKTKMHELFLWHDSLKAKVINAYQFKAITFDLLDRKVVSPSNFAAYRTAVGEELRQLNATDKNRIPLYAVHGGATRMLRDYSLEQQQPRSAALVEVVDAYLPMAMVA